MSNNLSMLGPPPQIPSSMMQAPIIETPPQPLPQLTQRRASKEIKHSSPIIHPGKGINQNRNPNAGLNFKNGVEIISNPSSIDKLTENLKNISNIIGNPTPIQSVPQPMPIVTKPEVPKGCIKETSEETKNNSKLCRSNQEQELEKICGEHEQIVNLILEEEEEMIAAHKQHVDEIVEMVKYEMNLLQELDKPGSDVDAYAASLDSALASKVEAVNSLRNKLSSFRSHLKQEKQLSKKFFEQQNFIEENSNNETQIEITPESLST